MIYSSREIFTIHGCFCRFEQSVIEILQSKQTTLVMHIKDIDFLPTSPYAIQIVINVIWQYIL